MFAERNIGGNTMRTRTKKRPATGYTLLELVMATFIMAAVLVPALALMRESMQLSGKVETRGMLNTLCVSKLEEHLALAAVSFSDATVTGNFNGIGQSGLRFRVVRSTNPADGGIADRLMAITVTIWQDDDADTVLDAGEANVSLSTKLAKMVVYQNEATGS